MRLFPAGILILCALVASQSCKKSGLDPDVDTTGHEIRFDDPKTKASIIEDADIMDFGVFIEKNLGKAGSPTENKWESLIENERVYRVGNTDDFTYDNTRFWVFDREFFFFGVHPYGTSVTRTAEETSSQTTFTYTVDLAVPYQANTDYMVAQKTVPVPLAFDVETPVDMNFRHLLSKVVIKIKKSSDYNAGDTFIVTQIGLSGISRNGTLTATHAPGAYSETLAPTAESRQIRRQNLDLELTTEGVNVLDNDPEDGFEDGLLIMPQEFVDDQIKLSVAYTYQQDNDTEIQYSTLEVDIPADEINEWESGKSYTYSLELKIDNNIYISTPTVNSWGTAQSGGTIIIK